MGGPRVLLEAGHPKRSTVTWRHCATLEAHDFPAERLASDSPVSVLHGQSVLVTEFIRAKKSAGSKLPGGLGGFLARLHSLPLPSGAANRPSGALHHFAEGTRDDELRAARHWLDQIEPARARG